MKTKTQDSFNQWLRLSQKANRKYFIDDKPKLSVIDEYLLNGGYNA